MKRARILSILVAATMAVVVGTSLLVESEAKAQTPTPTPTPTATATPTPTPTPTPIPPIQLFNQKLARLQANAGSMPTPVTDVINSFTNVVTRAFNCPPGSKVNHVIVNITTQFIAWDANRAAATKSRAAGFYFWNVTWEVQGSTKIVTANNELMLDPAVMAADEANPPLGTLADEGLLYHELLHGQLLINAMATPAWQTKACNCVIDLGPADENHAQIPALVDTYQANRAPGVNVKVVEPPAQPADSNGNFDIDLGPTGKTEWTWEDLEPQGGSNVDMSSLDVTLENGNFHAKGKLIDKTKPGKFFLRIDPTAEWIIGGQENALMVLPLVGGVGGIFELPDVEALPADTTNTASTDHTGLAWTIGEVTIGVTLFVLVASGTIWYARRRCVR